MGSNLTATDIRKVVEAVILTNERLAAQRARAAAARAAYAARRVRPTEPVTHKPCTRCKRDLPLDSYSFHRTGLGKRHSWCKRCRCEHTARGRYQPATTNQQPNALVWALQ